MKNKIAISLRVSKKDQENGYGLDYQLEDCVKKIEEDYGGTSEYKIYSDTVSGKDDQRPSWQQLMTDAKNGEIDVVYFWRLDRMMRDEYYFYVNSKELEDAGVEIRFATQDLADPFHRAIQVAVAAEERRKIVERTKRGREMAMHKGKWVWGPPAYGYRYNKDNFWIEIDETQSHWVRKMFSWLVDEQCSLKEIVKRLNAEKVLTWTQSTQTKRKVSSTWYPRTVSRILLNELYTGKTHFHKYKKAPLKLDTVDNPDSMREKEDWFEVNVPQIITRETLEKAQKQLRKNSEFAKRKKNAHTCSVGCSFATTVDSNCEEFSQNLQAILHSALEDTLVSLLRETKLRARNVSTAER